DLGLRFRDACMCPVLKVLLCLQNVKNRGDARENQSPENRGEKCARDGEQELPSVRPRILDGSKKILHCAQALRQDFRLKVEHSGRIAGLEQAGFTLNFCLLRLDLACYKHVSSDGSLGERVCFVLRGGDFARSHSRTHYERRLDQLVAWLTIR